MRTINVYWSNEYGLWSKTDLNSNLVPPWPWASYLTLSFGFLLGRVGIASPIWQDFYILIYVKCLHTSWHSVTNAQASGLLPLKKDHISNFCFFFFFWYSPYDLALHSVHRTQLINICCLNYIKYQLPLRLAFHTYQVCWPRDTSVDFRARHKFIMYKIVVPWCLQLQLSASLSNIPKEVYALFSEQLLLCVNMCDFQKRSFFSHITHSDTISVT